MKKPDNVTDFAAILPYPTNVGAPAFTVPDVLQHKAERGVTATHFFETKFDELKDEYFKLVKLAEDTQLVYTATYNFIPVVGRTYSLYDNAGKIFLSIINVPHNILISLWSLIIKILMTELKVSKYLIIILIISFPI